MKQRNLLLAASVLLSLPEAKAENIPPVVLPLFSQTQANAGVITRASSYDYAPSLIYDTNSNNYHIYWCGEEWGTRAADYILHAQADNLNGPWHASNNSQAGTYDIVLSPTNDTSKFDGYHVCDPTVMQVGKEYYLYYGGLRGAKNGEDSLGAIGVAKGTSPVNFERLNQGNPIAVPSKTGTSWIKNKLFYGVGQPAVTYRAPYYYLIFTDTTAAGSNSGSGAGQYVLRSPSPAFERGVEELSDASGGWRSIGSGTQRSGAYSFLNAFSVDLAYDPFTRRFIVAQNMFSPFHTRLGFFDDNWTLKAYASIPNIWQDGPGLLVGENRHMQHRVCSNLPADIVTATPPYSAQNNNPWSWDITRSSANVDLSSVCADPLPERPGVPLPVSSTDAPPIDNGGIVPPSPGRRPQVSPTDAPPIDNGGIVPPSPGRRPQVSPTDAPPIDNGGIVPPKPRSNPSPLPGNVMVLGTEEDFSRRRNLMRDLTEENNGNSPSRAVFGTPSQQLNPPVNPLPTPTGTESDPSPSSDTIGTPSQQTRRIQKLLSSASAVEEEKLKLPRTVHLGTAPGEAEFSSESSETDDYDFSGSENEDPEDPYGIRRYETSF